jgi:hypothetical protein
MNAAQLLEVIRDAYCRVMTARDWMEEGDNRGAESLLHDLEHDLAGVVEAEDEMRRAA